MGKFPIIDCPKCLVFWSVLAYSIVETRRVIPSLTISFLSSYCALWLELLEGYIDTIYMRFYEKIYANAASAAAADSHRGDSESAVSELRKEDND